MAVVVAAQPVPLAPEPEPAPSARELLVYRQPLLRGLCIGAVVVTHVVSGLEKMPRFTWLTGLLVVLHSAARFAVPCFLLLSGLHLGLTRRNERALGLYRRTLKYLLVPYLLWTVVYSLVNPAGWTVLSIAKSLALANAWGHLWFMGTIIQLYLLHPFLARWYRRSGRPGAFVLGALALQTIFAAAMPVLRPALGEVHPAADFALTFLGRSCLSHLGYFVLGYWVLEHADDVVALLRRRRAALVGGAAWLLLALVQAAYWVWPLSRGLAFAAVPHAYLVHRLLTPFMAIAALVAVGALLVDRPPAPDRRPSRLQAVVLSLGVHSYGVYLAHPLVLFVGTGALGLWAIRADQVAYYPLLFLFTAGVTLVAVRLLAKLPFGRYLG